MGALAPNTVWVFEQAIMAVVDGRMDDWWYLLYPPILDAQRCTRRMPWSPNLSLQRVASRTSAHFYALDTAFRFMDEMTNLS